jgi:hypothetical protein
VRRPMTPSGTNLLGLVRHLAGVEYQWFGTTFGRAIEQLETDPVADMNAGPHETTAHIVAFTTARALRRPQCGCWPLPTAAHDRPAEQTVAYDDLEGCSGSTSGDGWMSGTRRRLRRLR